MPRFRLVTLNDMRGSTHWEERRGLLALRVLGLSADRSPRPWRGTLDYMFANHRLRVLECEGVLNQPAPHDPTLYPSDHFGVAATVELA
jgi:hypothetical protein